MATGRPSEETSFSIEDALQSQTNLGNLSVIVQEQSEVSNFSDVELNDSLQKNESLPLDITFDKIASILLRDNLLLTALEFHTELLEAGKEIPRLKDFFSNPGNFEKQGFYDTSPILPRTSSIQTFDSLDFTRYSDDADRQLDERVAVLEFELRKAKDTINALRANLTVATESDPSSPINVAYKNAPDQMLKPHEKRALNFLVNEYLLKNNYKLSSITFSDENEDQPLSLLFPMVSPLLLDVVLGLAHHWQMQPAPFLTMHNAAKASSIIIIPNKHLIN